jgi:hypothetical protein
VYGAGGRAQGGYPNVIPPFPRGTRPDRQPSGPRSAPVLAGRRPLSALRAPGSGRCPGPSVPGAEGRRGRVPTRVSA